VLETNDLIYEGIATIDWPVIRGGIYQETNDLIYEGIATISGDVLLMLHQEYETNDLIYEGIATTGRY